MANEIEAALTTLATQAALAVTAQGTGSTAIDALTTAVTALSLPQGVPAGATPFSASNQAAATTAATPVVVRTSPGATRMFITEARIFNTTTAEIAVVDLRDSVGDVVLATLGTGAFDDDGAISGAGIYKFDPPLIVPVSADLEVTPFATIGDTWCSVSGYDAA